MQQYVTFVEKDLQIFLKKFRSLGDHRPNYFMAQ